MEKVKCSQCGNDNPATSRYCSRCGYELPKLTTEAMVPAPEPAVKASNDKRKRVIGMIAGALSFFIAYFAVQEIFFKPPSFDKALMEVANEINKNCPITLDQDTRLDNVLALPGNEFQYTYTLVNMEKSQTDVEELRKYLEPKIVSNVKTSPDLKNFREHKTTLVYNYVDKNRAFILKITVTPDIYE
jgi:hypothetical protein